MSTRKTHRSGYGIEDVTIFRNCGKFAIRDAPRHSAAAVNIAEFQRHCSVF